MRAPQDIRSRGFSFTEVLFAVMILGVGFIMVAAIFPVAIQQARTSTEETTGASVSRGGANYLEKIATNITMPATDNVVVGPDFDGLPGMQDGVTIATSIRGSLVTPSDSRFAWVPFYRRAGIPDQPLTWSPFAQVYMVPVLARAESAFVNGGPLVLQGPSGVFPNGRAVIRGNLVDGLNGAPDTITFTTTAELDVLSEGAFVILADATGAGNGVIGSEQGPKWDREVAPHVQGRVYRLGNPVPPQRPADPPTTWELMPGFDFDPIRIDADGDPMNGAPPIITDGKEVLVRGLRDLENVAFFVVGRALSPGDRSANAAREGATQDVSAYTTFVTVK